MADSNVIAETPTWHENIYEIQRKDPVLGGKGNISNKQAEALADRTAYLKQQTDSIMGDLYGGSGGSAKFATLDADGKIPASLLPDTVMEYKGLVTPGTTTLTDGEGNNGDYYIVKSDGEMTFSATHTEKVYENDRIIYNGTTEEYEVLSSSKSGGAMFVKGNWNASTNFPKLSDDMADAKTGDMYLVSVGGEQDLGAGKTVYRYGDAVVYSGTRWMRLASDVTQVVFENEEVGAIKYVSSELDIPDGWMPADGAPVYTVNIPDYAKKHGTYAYSTTEDPKPRIKLPHIPVIGVRNYNFARVIPTNTEVTNPTAYTFSVKLNCEIAFYTDDDGGIVSNIDYSNSVPSRVRFQKIPSNFITSSLCDFVNDTSFSHGGFCHVTYSDNSTAVVKTVEIRWITFVQKIIPIVKVSDSMQISKIIATRIQMSAEDTRTVADAIYALEAAGAGGIFAKIMTAENSTDFMDYFAGTKCLVSLAITADQTVNPAGDLSVGITSLFAGNRSALNINLASGNITFKNASTWRDVGLSLTGAKTLTLENTTMDGVDIVIDSGCVNALNGNGKSRIVNSKIKADMFLTETKYNFVSDFALIDNCEVELTFHGNPSTGVAAEVAALFDSVDAIRNTVIRVYCDQSEVPAASTGGRIALLRGVKKCDNVAVIIVSAAEDLTNMGNHEVRCFVGCESVENCNVEKKQLSDGSAWYVPTENYRNCYGMRYNNGGDYNDCYVSPVDTAAEEAERVANTAAGGYNY